ncbi:MAG: glucosamine-6-phosphate deaminase [Candidatus Omnitrophica bacterium]|nr:glucosamine-6-phosphate deaminase [Candidatus Omnitrophota bacterium]
MKVIICDDSKNAAKHGAEIFAEVINKKPDVVLGLATGSTPVELYKELIRMNKEGALSFKRVKSFNLDEYLGLTGDHPQSYRYFMNKNLFDHIDIEKSNTLVPDGTSKKPEVSCKQYEESIKKANGVDLQLLGIGSNGHIAFNEPGSPLTSRTRVVDLKENTINDNARFFSNKSEVPKKAVTMGIGTILEAKKIVLIATGANKKNAVSKSLNGKPDTDIPASFLQNHPDCTFIVDKEASSQL